MGYFSWLFADKNNEQNLRIDKSGYIACPDGDFIKESCYEGYGEFNGFNIYELVVYWNRKFLAANPDFVLPHERRKIGATDGKTVKSTQALKDFWWYPTISDLSIPLEDFDSAVKDRKDIPVVLRELRCIGIDIACHNEDNAALPYPIKITKTKKVRYDKLPASKNDPEQGVAPYYVEHGTL